ncbi:MAG: lysine--tRNA ligase [Deltaproteobacteria bacterium]|nr:lysine--tRNA ligase [Deltaproteobacteria bacterium]
MTKEPSGTNNAVATLGAASATTTSPTANNLGDDLGGAEESSSVLEARQKKSVLLAESIPIFPNTFRPTDEVLTIHRELGAKTAEELEDQSRVWVVAGRLMAKRDYGKSTFFDLQDPSAKIQLFLKRDLVEPKVADLAKKLDIGDLIGVKGRVFKTKTGELTILVDHLELVTKSLWPLPEKFHEMSVELKYRRRYVDLIMNETSRRVFRIRSQVVSFIRRFLDERGFLEVETPMMQPIPGGAAARPFTTYHNALDRTLYLRVAPELYLKRLLVGGLGRVYEVNRNFRNEGVSIQHNPEFTMLEFYQSFANFNDLMDLTEVMFAEAATTILGSPDLVYQGQPVSFKSPWRRLTFHEALETIGGTPKEVLFDHDQALSHLASLGGEKTESDPLGKILAKIFDLTVEQKLIDPTFITMYPADISPLARRNDHNPDLTDRFELFITGREIANGFSELNDPLDQKDRFLAQVAEREAGDEEGMFFDEDYVRALMYGMPPAAGEGVGIDRLIMLLTDSASIRDVILFPHLRSEK